MRPTETLSDNVEDAWQKAGTRLFRAVGETALTLGGPEVAEKIHGMAVLPDTTWPSPAALAELDRLYPGAAEQAMMLAEKTQVAEHQAELDALNDH